MDKRLSLAEVAEIWKPTDSAGEPLTGTAAIEAVLKLVFVSLEGVRLQASYDFAAPIQAERFIWPDTGKGFWERFDLTGLVYLRFRGDHTSTDDGCIWIVADDGLDGVPNVLVVLPDNPRQKVRVTCQCRMVAEDDFFTDSAVRIDEQRLTITEDSLREYARARGREDVLKRLDTQTAGGAVAADDVVVDEAKGQVESKTTKPVSLLLPSKDELLVKFTEQAQKLLDGGSTRKAAAEKLKGSGATHIQIGQILTNDGSKNRTDPAWDKRGSRLLKGELKGFV